MHKVLIIEDEIHISDLIALNLNSAGLDTSQAFDGEEGLELLDRENPDLVILDIMLPKKDGYQIMPIILKKNIPIILLTARNSLKDRVYGLNSGAEDYILKPFEGPELIARVKLILKRNSKGEKVKNFGNIQVFSDRRRVLEEDEEIEFTAKEYELLEYLIENKGFVLSREKLLEKVWGYDFFGGTRTVDMHIQKLRSKLKSIKIETVYKIGYRLE